MNSFICQSGLDKEDTRYRVALILSFVLPVIIMLSIFITRGIFPFGNRSFLYSDMYHQYMPFFSEFLRKIKSGEGLSYTYNVGIGTNFLALFVYYLSSPLNYLAFLVPEAYLMEFMSYLIVVKIGLCGLTFFLYLKKHFGCKDATMLFFSVFYAMSGFIAAYNWNIMWLDCIFLFPLIIWGLERLVKEGRCGLYCLTLALSIFSNYYISIMICIFLVLYFVVLLITEKRSFRIVGHFALYSLLAGGLAACLLVPEVCAILGTKMESTDLPNQLKSYFSVLDMLARHCVSVTTERGLEHWPNIYCGTAVFLLIPMYTLNQKISIRRRFLNLALAGFLLLSFSTNMLDFIWHGMSYPNSLPARQSFIYIFLVLVMCFEAYRNVEESDKKLILYGYLAAVVFLLGCEKFVDSEDFETGIEILTLVFVTIYAVVLYLHCTRKSICWKFVLGMVTLVAVVTESSINMMNTSVGTTSRSAYLDIQPDYRTLAEWVEEQDSEFYRIEKFTRKTKNDGALTDYPTASVFCSTLNSNVMELYKRLGMRHSKVFYCFDGATAFTSALLNVKYMFGESDKYGNDLFEQLQQSGEVYLYGAKAQLPFGYVAPIGYDLPEGYENNGLRLQNAMVKELGLDGDAFKKVFSQRVGDDVMFTADEVGVYYALVTATGTKKIEAIGGQLETHNFSDLKNGAVLYLGQLQTGDSMTLTNGDEEDESRNISVDIYRMDTELVQEALEILSRTHLENVSYDSTRLSGQITMEEEGRLILSIPYEKGWKILVNGEETEAQLFGEALIALDLQPGDYTISMEYVPCGKVLGIAISVISALLFAAITVCRKYCHKNSSPTI